MQASLKSGLGFVAPLERAWHYRELIRARFVRRELASRFRGSILGWLWAVFGPIVMLTAYTINLLRARSACRSPPRPAASAATRCSIFTGLIIFNLFSELAYRAPGLLHEHVHFIKKSIFPSETLAWTASIRALTYAAISFVVLLAFAIFRMHGLPWTVLLLPLIVVPLHLFLLGAIWFLMALGSFTLARRRAPHDLDRASAHASRRRYSTRSTTRRRACASSSTSTSSAIYVEMVR